MIQDSQLSNIPEFPKKLRDFQKLQNCRIFIVSEPLGTKRTTFICRQNKINPGERLDWETFDRIITQLAPLAQRQRAAKVDM